MKRLLRLNRNEKGFTLIELLVVVAILSVLAAVIVPNVGKFIGSGTVESANTEAHNVQTAVIAYMADNQIATITGGGSVGPAADLPAGKATTTAKSFLVNATALQATYTIGTDGSITGASPVATGKWSDLTYTAGTGWAD